MKRFIGFVILIFFSFSSYSQYKLDWSRATDSTGGSNYRKMIIHDNYIYSCGNFSGVSVFNTGTGSITLSTLGNTAVFISKTDTLGNIIWIKQYGDFATTYVNSLKIDDNNNLILCGQFQNGTADFDPGSGTFNLIADEIDGYILKLDTAGNFIWAKEFNQLLPNRVCNITSIESNSSNEIWFIGSFDGMVDFDPGPATLNINNTSPFGFIFQSFIGKLDANGNLVSLYPYNESWMNLQFTDLVVNQNDDLYVSLIANSGVDLDFTTGMDSISPIVPTASIIKIDVNENYLWSKTFYSNVSSILKVITLNANDEIYSLGEFSDSLDVDPSLVENWISSNGIRDLFLIKLDANGNLLQTKQILGEGGEFATTIFVDDNEYVYLGGVADSYLADSIDLNPDQGYLVPIQTAPGTVTPFLIKLNSFGNFVWGGVYGSDNSSYINALVTDVNGAVYFAGHYTGNYFDINPTVDSTLFGNTNPFSSKAYLGRLNKTCSSYHWPIQVFVCEDFTVPSGDEIYNMSGSFTDTLVNSNGCDSIVYFNLEVFEIDTTLSINQLTLTSSYSGGTYQWLECSNNFAILAGQNLTSFTATSNGDYALEISKNGCVDTTNCYTISTVGINEWNDYNQVFLYPNPANENATLEYNTTEAGNHSIIISDITGKIISIQNYSAQQGNNSLNLNLNSIESGMYLITVADANGNQTTLRITKQ